MKLRNKKTGEIGVLEAATYHGGRPDNIVEVYEVGMGAVRSLAQYHTLEELNEDWEDCYKPAEPLIEDERIRKIIRAWAGENDSMRIEYAAPKNELVDSYGNTISFNLIFRDLKDGGTYTIAELCGEEDEDEA